MKRTLYALLPLFLLLACMQDAEIESIATEKAISTDEKAVRIEAPEPFIPCCLSPNGDGINDLWKVDASQTPYVLSSVKIYTRWGEYIVDSGQLPAGLTEFSWDGKKNGVPVDSGYYMYEVVIVDRHGSTKEMTGRIVSVH